MKTITKVAAAPSTGNVLLSSVKLKYFVKILHMYGFDLGYLDKTKKTLSRLRVIPIAVVTFICTATVIAHELVRFIMEEKFEALLEEEQPEKDNQTDLLLLSNVTTTTAPIPVLMDDDDDYSIKLHEVTSIILSMIEVLLVYVHTIAYSKKLNVFFTNIVDRIEYLDPEHHKHRDDSAWEKTLMWWDRGIVYVSIVSIVQGVVFSAWQIWNDIPLFKSRLLDFTYARILVVDIFLCYCNTIGKWYAFYYITAFVILCKMIVHCFDALVLKRLDFVLNKYQRMHNENCHLVRDLNSHYLIYCFYLITKVIAIVLFNVRCQKIDPYTIPHVLIIVVFIANCARLNSKVKSSLCENITDVTSNPVSPAISVEQVNFMIYEKSFYIENPTLTYGNAFILSRSFLFKIAGVIITYGIILYNL